ncbi:hypothetical protein Scep_027733 [Stephania cephalantha]|uniref:Uncharacterized protein n=1 Tax=Stephania cephalantha TaxID=152367 RepID=A0AAP0HLD8_9MAGN
MMARRHGPRTTARLAARTRRGRRDAACEPKATRRRGAKVGNAASAKTSSGSAASVTGSARAAARRGVGCDERRTSERVAVAARLLAGSCTTLRGGDEEAAGAIAHAAARSGAAAAAAAAAMAAAAASGDRERHDATARQRGQQRRQRCSTQRRVNNAMALSGRSERESTNVDDAIEFGVVSGPAGTCRRAGPYQVKGSGALTERILGVCRTV